MNCLFLSKIAVAALWLSACSARQDLGVDDRQWDAGNQIADSGDTPLLVAKSPGGSPIAAGDFSTCAITQNNGVRCWGSNGAGQLGDGTKTQSLPPVDVKMLANIVGLAAGADHNCALSTLGTVTCWGDNGQGQIGDGTQQNRFLATPVDLKNVVRISAGVMHTCAITSDGTVWCWGSNSSGQLGDGTANNWRGTPWPLDGLTARAVSVVAGLDHTCVLQENGEVRCAGAGKYGQVGRTLPSTKAIAIGLSTTTMELAASWIATCARLTTGQIECWGSNAVGELGNGNVDPVDPVVLPTKVKEFSAATALSAGLGHFCAQRESLLYCWGWNDFGQLGNGDAGEKGQSKTHLSATPTIPVDLKDVTTFASGGRHNCAFVASGTNARASVKCWGHNSHGQLGDGTQVDRPSPVLVSGW